MLGREGLRMSPTPIVSHRCLLAPGLLLAALGCSGSSASHDGGTNDGVANDGGRDPDARPGGDAPDEMATADSSA
jgi:hypothetical protein